MYRILLIEDGTYIYESSSSRYYFYSDYELRKYHTGQKSDFIFVETETIEEMKRVINRTNEEVILYLNNVVISEHPEMFEIVEV